MDGLLHDNRNTSGTAIRFWMQKILESNSPLCVSRSNVTWRIIKKTLFTNGWQLVYVSIACKYWHPHPPQNGLPILVDIHLNG
jgi:hypothetical protein